MARTKEIDGVTWVHGDDAQEYAADMGWVVYDSDQLPEAALDNIGDDDIAQYLVGRGKASQVLSLMNAEDILDDLEVSDIRDYLESINEEDLPQAKQVEAVKEIHFSLGGYDLKAYLNSSGHLAVTHLSQGNSMLSIGPAGVMLYQAYQGLAQVSEAKDTRVRVKWYAKEMALLQPGSAPGEQLDEAQLREYGAVASWSPEGCTLSLEGGGALIQPTLAKALELIQKPEPSLVHQLMGQLGGSNA